MKENQIPQAEDNQELELKDLGTLASRIYRTGILLAKRANKIKSGVTGSISNDRGQRVEKDERNFITRMFQERGWKIKITSKNIATNDIQGTDGRSWVEISIKKDRKNKKK